MAKFSVETTISVLSLMMCSTIAAPSGVNQRSATSIRNCPRIVNREEWGARETTGLVPITVSPAPYVVVHHGGIPHYCYDEETCSRIVRGYQDLHIDVNGWVDVGYHFLIGGDGNVYEGRGWDKVGAHVRGYNGHGIGICIIGDYTSHMPNNASLKALESLIECGISLGKIVTEYKMIGHRQGRDTECPGSTLYEYLQTLPHWEPNPVPLFSTSTSTSTSTKTNPVTNVVVPSVNIIGTKRWTDLIALGVPDATASITTEDKIEENVVETEIDAGSGKITSKSN